MGVRISDDIGIILLGMDDMPFGPGEQGVRLGSSAFVGKDGGAGALAVSRPAQGLDPDYMQGETDKDEGIRHEQGPCKAPEPPHFLRPARKARPPSRKCGVLAANLMDRYRERRRQIPCHRAV